MGGLWAPFWWIRSRSRFYFNFSFLFFPASAASHLLDDWLFEYASLSSACRRPLVQILLLFLRLFFFYTFPRSFSFFSSSNCSLSLSLFVSIDYTYTFSLRKQPSCYTPEPSCYISLPFRPPWTQIVTQGQTVTTSALRRGWKWETWAILPSILPHCLNTMGWVTCPWIRPMACPSLLPTLLCHWRFPRINGPASSRLSPITILTRVCHMFRFLVSLRWLLSMGAGRVP